MNTYPRPGSKPSIISDRPRPKAEYYICLSCADVVRPGEVTGAGGHARGMDHCGPVITTTEMLRQYNEMHEALLVSRCTCIIRPRLVCPDCNWPLGMVPPSRTLNGDQWDAVKAGDYYCTGNCKSDAASTGMKYWWSYQLATYVVNQRCLRCIALDIQEPEVIEQ